MKKAAKKKDESFKFKFKKVQGIKNLSFDTKQIENYSAGTKVDFVAVLLFQLNQANGKVQLCRENWEDANKNVEKFNSLKLCPKDIIELHFHRSLMDYCKHHINICPVSDYKTMLELFEEHYNWQEKHRNK